MFAQERSPILCRESAILQLSRQYITDSFFQHDFQQA